MQDTIPNTITTVSECNATIIRCMHRALRTYSNVDRGYGHYSLATEALMDEARRQVLAYLDLDKVAYVVIFCSPLAASNMKPYLPEGSYFELRSSDFNLPVGLRALAVQRRVLPDEPIDQVGGGVVRIVGKKKQVWAEIPDRFEAGTKSIINAIAFAFTLKNHASNRHDHFRKNLDIQENNKLDGEYYEQQNASGPELHNMIRRQVIGIDTLIPTSQGARHYIHLDHAASTPALVSVWNTVNETLNLPASKYSSIVKNTKEICSHFFGAPLKDYEILFTSGTTESINIGSKNFTLYTESGQEPVLVNTILEHNSNELPWRLQTKAQIIRLKVDKEGLPDMKSLENLLYRYNHLRAYGRKYIRLVAITGVSNVLGSFLPIKDIGMIAHKYGARMFVDGAQWVAHRKINLSEFGVDGFAFSGHKMYAPFGTGVLIIRKECLKFNQNQLRKIRVSGEENVVGIAALGKAIRILQRIGMENIEDYEKGLIRRTLESLQKIPGITVYGMNDPNAPGFDHRSNIVSFTVNKMPHNLVVRSLAEYGGIGSRSGCLCAHLLIKHLLRISRVRSTAAHYLTRLIPDEINPVLPGLVRISFGIGNTKDDVERFIQSMEQITGNPISMIHKLFACIHSGTPFLPRMRIQKQIDEFVQSVVNGVFYPNEEPVYHNNTKK